jgi:hypothetical protein
MSGPVPGIHIQFVVPGLVPGIHIQFVMPGLVPGIHVLAVLRPRKTWMAGTTPGHDGVGV